ncbi:MAG TPA: cupredoxin domain-containing protein [Gammaproteobacteria bacterium]|nr:cupredoxin domain-containing protein [Gammaproteobacteria bacterium]
MKPGIPATALLLAAGLLVGTTCQAGGLPAFPLVIENGRFHPEVVEVPAGKRFKLVITNKGPGPEEFESRKLRKEKVLAPGVTRSVVFAPLKPGEYRFFGEFHPDTAQGRIVAR